MLEILNKKRRFLIVFLISFSFFVLLIFGIFFSAPKEFPKNDMVVIPKGASVLTAGKILEQRHIINHPAIFSILIKIINSEDGVIAGGYFFSKKENVFTVAKRLGSGDHRLETIRITFPEGFTVKEMAKLCKETLPLCNEDEFIKLGSSLEGRLYPDTYFFLQSSNEEDVLMTMKETFDQKFSQLDKEIRSFGKSEEDVLIMASILEKEAQNFENRQMVASILWKRISLGMPLQVDASLQYETGKNTYQLTTKDLSNDSPYNTYTNKGLPPTPIANPGIDSIKAAITISPTKYLYYLTDRSGRFYFAETHEKHVENKRLYLNRI